MPGVAGLRYLRPRRTREAPAHSTYALTRRRQAIFLGTSTTPYPVVDGPTLSIPLYEGTLSLLSLR